MRLIVISSLPSVIDCAIAAFNSLPVIAYKRFDCFAQYFAVEIEIAIGEVPRLCFDTYRYNAYVLPCQPAHTKKIQRNNSSLTQ
jgi:hypothetical protein